MSRFDLRANEAAIASLSDPEDLDELNLTDEARRQILLTGVALKLEALKIEALGKIHRELEQIRGVMRQG